MAVKSRFIYINNPEEFDNIINEARSFKEVCKKVIALYDEKDSEEISDELFPLLFEKYRDRHKTPKALPPKIVYGQIPGMIANIIDEATTTVELCKRIIDLYDEKGVEEISDAMFSFLFDKYKDRHKTTKQPGQEEQLEI